MTQSDDVKLKDASVKKEFPTIVWNEWFWPKFAPKWFEFLSWVLMYGLFDVVFKKTLDPSVGIVLTISFMAMINYLYGKLLNFFSNVPGVFNKRSERIIFAVLSSFIIMLCINFLVRRVVDQLITTGKI